MCLLVVAHRVAPDFPLVVAANRDERTYRPAVSLTVLQRSAPAILGGRDLQAGGTWLAVNERGVVAGLTNRPSPTGLDPGRRSRGELPLLLAGEPSADAAVEAFAARVEPSSYNPAWLLVGDGRSLFYLELDGVRMSRCESLPTGVHVLENHPLGEPSGKVDRARELLGDLSALPEDLLVERLVSVLSDHETESFRRPACVHEPIYATRSSTIVLVPEEPRPIRVLVADGQPCSTPFADQTGRWPAARS